MIAIISKYMLLSVFGLAIVWDLVALCIDRQGTLSKITIQSASTYPSIALILGFLLGHMFWPMDILSESEYWRHSLPIAFMGLTIFLLWDLIYGITKSPFPICYLLVGLIVGHLFWPQKLM